MNIAPPDPAIVRHRLELALAEDGVDRDITSLATIPPDAPPGRFDLRPREPGVFAGEAVLDAVARRFADRCQIARAVGDGDAFVAGQRLATLTGEVRAILGIERTLLNFLQRLCGVATLTRRYVDAARPGGARIYDTRKTIPGWRDLDKYAVRCGGGCNHRMGLHDAVLIKDNHVSGAPAADLARLVAEARQRLAVAGAGPDFIEVEVDTLEQFREVLRSPGVNIILLDNFAIESMREAVALRNAAGLRGRVEIEVSGGVTLETTGAIAATGVDRIAVGAITHSARAIDLGLDAVG